MIHCDSMLTVFETRLRRPTMAATVNVGHTSRFQIGRIILLVAAALMTLNHSVLIFALDDPVLFMGYAAFNLYALIVIAIPFSRSGWQPPPRWPATLTLRRSIMASPPHVCWGCC